VRRGPDTGPVSNRAAFDGRQVREHLARGAVSNHRRGLPAGRWSAGAGESTSRNWPTLKGGDSGASGQVGPQPPGSSACRSTFVARPGWSLCPEASADAGPGRSGQDEGRPAVSVVDVAPRRKTRGALWGHGVIAPVPPPRGRLVLRRVGRPRQGAGGVIPPEFHSSGLLPGRCSRRQGRQPSSPYQTKALPARKMRRPSLRLAHAADERTHLVPRCEDSWDE